MAALTVCRTCKASIFWASTTKVPMPIDAEPVADGNLVIEEQELRTIARAFEPLFDGGRTRYVSHFATCPNAAQHRAAKSDSSP